MCSLLRLQRMCGRNTAAERAASCLPIIVFNQRSLMVWVHCPSPDPSLYSLHCRAGLPGITDTVHKPSPGLSTHLTCFSAASSSRAWLTPQTLIQGQAKSRPFRCMLKPAGNHQAVYMSQLLVRTNRCSGGINASFRPLSYLNYQKSFVCLIVY